ncbi:MAG: Stk1 family PASTA domain-containing Ser/Thr kinase, partial [Oscillospiraceae bacterium]|nr:Stk1 family PASTA domain-containing Ser/Thr kinase [Oscillospiraceae bacterium]
MDNLIGKKLDGRYQVIEIIGIGGMANVYKARDLLEEKTVAVKVLKEEFAASDEFLRRFKNESKAISLLSHPNIVKVFDVSFSEKINYIVMEHIDGITLKEYIQGQHVLSWQDAVHFAVQILRALQHAHDRGIVHRDIKPQNIMLLADGSLKVMDFGIARFARSGSRTITDKAIGSVHYISPEQAKGDETDAQADIYSTGVIMFEMLTGQLPFEAESAVSVAIKQISDKPTLPSTLNPEIPEGLEEIILKAMQKDTSGRYRTASEMLHDIEEFKKNPSISFQYKYFVDSDPTKYIETIADVRERNGIKQVKEEKNKVNGIVVLAGIAAAFLLAAMVLVGVLVFSGGGSGKMVKVPNVTGMTYDEAIAQYPDYKFEIEQQLSNDNVEEGRIISQLPKENGKFNPKKTSIRLTVSTGVKMVVIDDVISMEGSIAESKLTKSGLIVKKETVTSDSVPENYVVKIEPGVGTEVEPGSTVTIYISSGAKESDKVTVPNVVGTNLKGASILFDRDNLKIGKTTEQESTTYPAGFIISQSPASGTVKKGTAINLVISSGPPKPKTMNISFE